MQAVVFIGRPETNLEGAIGDAQAGRSTPSQLQSVILAVGRTSPSGEFRLPNIPRGQTLPVAIVAPSYRSIFLRVSTSTQDEAVSIGPIQMIR